MGRRAVLVAGLLTNLALSQTAQGQQGTPPSEVELAAITARGRALAGYDQAAWHATDAAQAANPKTVDGLHYLARLENGKWTVVFGALNAGRTKFLIHYEAAQGDKPQQFDVTRDDPPKEESGFFLFAARALEAALADFGTVARPYNTAVVPAADGNLYVYVYPASVKAGVYPLGGDVRYLISADGLKLLEKRQLHKTIIESSPAKGKKVVAGIHTHVLSDVPEDTDVLHVLQQNPPQPEYVGTPHFTYPIAADGTIHLSKKRR